MKYYYISLKFLYLNISTEVSAFPENWQNLCDHFLQHLLTTNQSYESFDKRVYNENDIFTFVTWSTPSPNQSPKDPPTCHRFIWCATLQK